MQDQLKSAQQIQTSECAFAAILTDGSIVAWGHEEFGAHRGVVQDPLNGVQHWEARPEVRTSINFHI